jgi:5-methylcytosine-specific restriction protein A
MTPRLYPVARVPTKEQFVQGLQALADRLTIAERNLLVEQYRFPMHTCFATDLAGECSIAHHATVNRIYARAAERFCNETGFEPNVREDGSPQWWTTWSDGIDYGKGWFAWRQHPALSDALLELTWVSDPVSELFCTAGELIDAEQLIEGGCRRVVVNFYERNPIARRRCLEFHGTACRVCGFDFEKTYGSIGRGFIHVHHLRPVSRAESIYAVNFVEDLLPVCPNCHSMLHTTDPPMHIEDLQAKLCCAVRPAVKTN